MKAPRWLTAVNATLTAAAAGALAWLCLDMSVAALVTADAATAAMFLAAAGTWLAGYGRAAGPEKNGGDR